MAHRPTRRRGISLPTSAKVLGERIVIYGHCSCGRGQKPRAAKRPAIITPKGLKIGVVGYTDNEPEGIEVYKNKLILYDTGGFVDDYMVGPTLRNDHTFLFCVAINKKGDSISTINACIDCKLASKSCARRRPKTDG